MTKVFVRLGLAGYKYLLDEMKETSFDEEFAVPSAKELEAFGSNGSQMIGWMDRDNVTYCLATCVLESDSYKEDPRDFARGEIVAWRAAEVALREAIK